MGRAVASRAVEQVPAEERQLGVGGLFVAAQEGLVVPAGHPDDLAGALLAARTAGSASAD